jgi:hypothetical protein
MGQFHFSLRRRQRLLEPSPVERYAVGRFGPFEAPAVIQTTGIHRVEAELIQQPDDLIPGTGIVRRNGERAAVGGAAGAAILQQILGQNRVEYLDHLGPHQMLGEQSAGGDTANRQRTAKLRRFIEAVLVRFGRG